MANNLEISNVINVSVSQTPQALSAFNTSNLALFSTETPAGSFPGAGYNIYLNPDGVATDFGTSSTTYKMAVAVFAQAPNILAGNGYLVVIALASSGAEKLDVAIPRTKSLVSYFGVMSTRIESQTDMLAAAAIIQANNMVGFFGSRTAADIANGGKLDLLRTGSLNKSRGLYYGAASDLDALLEQAAYAGRALSTDFTGSKTVSTMHLKALASIQPDPTLTQAQLVLAMAAGADTYPSIQGVSVSFCSGANKFFDEVYGIGWLVGALQVAGFNYLAQAATKIPQTESGMDGLKGAYRQVCEQAVSNGFSAPGLWTSPTTFGNQADLLQNVAQFGYYIYSTPINQQSTAQRLARQAPLCQIAIKEAGAFHSSNIIVNMNP